MLTITIPTPCHEDWNNMTPDQTGRHCSVCAKSVVDFTRMSDEEVKYFFLNRKADERVCGRFKQTQLHRIVIELPQNIFHIQMPSWKKFLAACLIVFSTTLFSCETKIKDTEPAVMQPVVLTGALVMDAKIVPAQQVPPPAKTSVGVMFCPPIIKGDIAFIEQLPAPAVDSTLKPVRDTLYAGNALDTVSIGLPIIAVKTKNPPEADSMNCNTIKNFN